MRGNTCGYHDHSVIAECICQWAAKSRHFSEVTDFSKTAMQMRQLRSSQITSKLPTLNNCIMQSYVKFSVWLEIFTFSNACSLIASL